MKTHQVDNQSPIFENRNLYEVDKALQKVLLSSAGSWGQEEMEAFGAIMGAAKWIDKGRLANINPPIFKSHDAKGHMINEIEFHPAYHDLMELGIANKLHSQPWSDSKKGAQLVRMAKYYFYAQNEAGSGCPITMTFSCIPAIQKNLPNAEKWVAKILSNKYDPSNKPWFEKEGLTIGMAMTEKQGGTDVRANTTKATPINKSGRGELYHLNGHKWFCSAPMCDAFLTLAQTENGLSCFLFPRYKMDGALNDFRIIRLKDKLGNRSNASSEIEFDGAEAWLMGEEGRGVATIIDMVALTRFDCMIGSTALMRRSLTEVLHHTKHRKVFGKKLREQPLMKQVVADLCLELYGALAMTARTATCLENSAIDSEKLLLRMLTPIGKYFITKRASPFIAEAMECLGGNGYVEDSILPRLYREAPVNAIWEGSGNVQCLDVLRAIRKSPEILDNFIANLEKQIGKIEVYDQSLTKLKSIIPYFLENEYRARTLVEKLAIHFQAACLIELGDLKIADSFCFSRLAGKTVNLFGACSIKYVYYILENT